MVVLRVFGVFLHAIITTARSIVYIVMRIFSFLANIVGLIGLVGVVMSIRSWLVTGWSYDIKINLLSSLIMFGGSFIYHLVMYIVNPKK